MDTYEKLFFELDKLLEGHAYEFDKFEQMVKREHPGTNAEDVVRSYGASISNVFGERWICKWFRQKQALIADIKAYNLATQLISEYDDGRVPVHRVMQETVLDRQHTYPISKAAMNNAFERLGYYIVEDGPLINAHLEFVGVRVDMKMRLMVADEVGHLGDSISLDMLRQPHPELTKADYEAGLEIARLRAEAEKGI